MPSVDVALYVSDVSVRVRTRFASAQSAPRYRRKTTSSCAATGFAMPLTVALSES